MTTIELTPDGGIDEYQPGLRVHPASSCAAARLPPARRPTPDRDGSGWVGSTHDGDAASDARPARRADRARARRGVARARPRARHRRARAAARSRASRPPAGRATSSEVPGARRRRGAPRSPRRELAAALQLGVGTGIGGGMIHSPSLFAPLVRHDRVHDNDQTVVTVWDLRPWEAPDELPRAAVAWHRAMLKRAVEARRRRRRADALDGRAAGRARPARRPHPGHRRRRAASASPCPTDEVGRRREPRPARRIRPALAAAPRAPTAWTSASRAVGALRARPAGRRDRRAGGRRARDRRPRLGRRHPRAQRARARGAVGRRPRCRCSAAPSRSSRPRAAPRSPGGSSRRSTLGVPVIAAESAVHAEVIVDGGSARAADVPTRSARMPTALGEGSRRSLASAARCRSAPCWPATAAARSRGARPPSGCGSCTRTCSAGARRARPGICRSQNETPPPDMPSFHLHALGHHRRGYVAATPPQRARQRYPDFDDRRRLRRLVGDLPGGGRMFSQLNDLGTNDRVQFLPESAESTQVDRLEDEFRAPGRIRGRGLHIRRTAR